jgi:glycosyltransferase involved in cell wall biosynthesis
LSHFAKCLADLGWEAHVLSTGSFQSALFGGQQDASLLSVAPESVRVVRAQSKVGSRLGPFLAASRIWDSQFRGWRQAAMRSLEGLYRGPGLVYALLPPADNAIVAHAFCEKHGLPLVVDFKDDYFRLERKIVARADVLLASTGISRDHILKRYEAPADKCAVFYNGICGSAEPPREAKADIARRVHFAFAGTFCATTRPERLIRAASILARQKPALAERVRISLIGPRSLYYYLRVRPLLSKAVQCRPFIPSYSALLKHLAAEVDVGICSFNENWTYGLSSKIFTYMAAGLPILAYGPAGGALQQFVEGNRIGLFSEIGDAEALIRNIEILATDAGIREDCAAQVRRIASQYTMEAQTRNIEPLFQALVS